MPVITHPGKRFRFWKKLATVHKNQRLNNLETLITNKVSVVLGPFMEMKARILAKAEELFCHYGIKSITMDEIATQLGISKKTIYLSFADKDELVLEVFNAQMNESKNHCLHDQQMADNAVHEIFLALDMMDRMLQTLNVSILYDLERYYPDTFKKFQAYKYDFLYKVVSQNLKRGIKEEVFRPDLNIDVITRLRLGTVMLSMNLALFPQNKYSPVEVEREIILHYLYGVATPKGVKLIQKYDLQRKKTSV